MEKTPDKLMSGIMRAEYIEADPNLSLYYTDADEDGPLVFRDNQEL